MTAAELVARSNASLSEALAAADIPAIVDHFTDDVVFLMPGSPPIEGKEAMTEWWQGFVAAGLKEAQMKTMTVEDRGDLIVEVGTYAMDLEPAGVPRFTDNGKYVVVYRRTGEDEVKMWTDIVNSDAGPEG